MMSIKLFVVTCMWLFLSERIFGASYGLRDPYERQTHNSIIDEPGMPPTEESRMHKAGVRDSEKIQTRDSLADDFRVDLTGLRNDGRKRIGGSEVRRRRKRRAYCCSRTCMSGYVFCCVARSCSDTVSTS